MSILIDGTNGITLPSGAVSNTTGTVVGTTDTQTLTNKTLVTPALGTPASGVMTNVTGINYDGFKNRLINGSMVIDQRNAGASVTATNSAPYTLDRWFAYSTPTSKFTVQQNAGSVTPPTGFSYYLGCTSSSAYSIGSGDLMAISQRVEGFNSADLAWGTASAATVTLSFWVRSSLTGTFGGSLQNNDQNYSYPFSYTISSANTWEYKTITITGPTAGTWLTTNGTGIKMWFAFGTGSTKSGTAGSWSANEYFSATGATSVVGTNGATFYITGVQLEKGSTATSFDYRPYGTELQLCQRYYQTYQYTGAAGCGFGMIRYNGAGNVMWGHPLKVTMRTSPSEIVTPTIGQASTNFTFLNGEAYPATHGSVNTTLATPDNVWFYFSGFSSLGSVGAGTWAYTTGTCTFRFGAEL
jgi:hypothetical protein